MKFTYLLQIYSVYKSYLFLLSIFKINIKIDYISETAYRIEKIAIMSTLRVITLRVIMHSKGHMSPYGMMVSNLKQIIVLSNFNLKKGLRIGLKW